MSKSNIRTLDVLAAEIRELERHQMLGVFNIGDLLVEAREQCGDGDWYPWLAENFDRSVDTAENYMRAARLPRTVRDLRLATRTFYALTRVDVGLLPAMIDALVKAGARERQFKPAEADRVMQLVRLRNECGGDLSDAALLALHDGCVRDPVMREPLLEAMLQERPATADEAARLVEMIFEEAEATAQAEAAEADKERLCHTHGDLPEATLSAISEWCQPGAEARSVVLAALKNRRPTTKAMADKIVAFVLERARAQVDAAPVQPRPAPPQPQPRGNAAGEPGWLTEQRRQQNGGEREQPQPDLIEALRTLLHYAQQPKPPTFVGADISGIDLNQIGEFVFSLHRAMRKGVEVKIAADKAEARSRRAT
jgi:hypothetical protein